MCLKIISYFSIFGILNSLDKYSTRGEKCLSVKVKQYTRKYDQIQCEENKSIYVERIWVDIQPICVYNKSQTISLSNEQFDISCSSSSFCQVEYYKPQIDRSYEYLHVRFRCKGCITIHPYSREIITCPASSIIRIADVSYGNKNCPANLKRRQINKYFKDLCKRWYSCSVTNKDPYHRTVSIYFQCRDGNDIKDNDIATESHSSYYISGDDGSTEFHGSYDIPVDGTSMDYHEDNYNSANDITTESYADEPVDDISKEYHGFSNYAFIVGGIVGTLLVICIIVGLFHFRKCICRKCRSAQKQSEKRITPTLNPTYDLTGTLNSVENIHRVNVMDASGAVHCSTSHTVYYDNRTDDISYAKVNKLCHIQKPGIQTNKEESSTYPYPRNTVYDSDDIYDHIVHDAAHRRITDGDYDVFGNYHESVSNK